VTPAPRITKASHGMWPRVGQTRERNRTQWLIRALYDILDSRHADGLLSPAPRAVDRSCYHGAACCTSVSTVVPWCPGGRRAVTQRCSARSQPGSGLRIVAVGPPPTSRCRQDRAFAWRGDLANQRRLDAHQVSPGCASRQAQSVYAGYTAPWATSASVTSTTSATGGAQVVS
jgi:hypothetical protein